MRELEQRDDAIGSASTTAPSRHREPRTTAPGGEANGACRRGGSSSVSYAASSANRRPPTPKSHLARARTRDRAHRSDVQRYAFADINDALDDLKRGLPGCGVIAL